MRRRTQAAILAVLLLAGVVLPASGSVPRDGPETAPNLKVAFFGDQSIGASAEAVLKLVSDEGADMVIHLGDFGYGDETDPQTAID